MYILKTNFYVKPPKNKLLRRSWGVNFRTRGGGAFEITRRFASRSKHHQICAFASCRLAGPQLVQMFIGDGAKLVRDAFELAKEKIKQRRGAFLGNSIEILRSEFCRSLVAGLDRVKRLLREGSLDSVRSVLCKTPILNVRSRRRHAR